MLTVSNHSWEMSTIGHPLSDLINLITPFLLSEHNMGSRTYPSFTSTNLAPGLPTKEQAVKWYNEVAGWDAFPDLAYGAAFGMFRGTCIFQGIAARYAMRQASSAQAKATGALMGPWADLSWNLVREARDGGKAKEKL